jgi:hypothetical protein
VHILRLVAVVAAIATPGVARAAGTPQQKCQAAKSKLVGKYTDCEEKAAAKQYLTGDTVVYNKVIYQCRTKLSSGWQKADAAAVAVGVACPEYPLGESDFQAVIDALTTRIATALSGGGLDEHFCGNGAVDGGEDCDQSNLNGQTCVTRGFVSGSLRCGVGCTFDTSGCFATRFVDNGDGTIADHQTRLQWEKKGNLDGAPNLGDPHDADNTYAWSDFTRNDGTGFLDGLNTCSSNGGTAVDTAGFAGKCDWRLPSITELRTIFDPNGGRCLDLGGIGACIDPIFGPTALNEYWSATPLTARVDTAWLIDFNAGFVTYGLKVDAQSVRAVRTSP